MEPGNSMKSQATNSKTKGIVGNGNAAGRNGNGSSATSPRAHFDNGGADDRERLRLALHDGLGQLLTSISFLAGSLRQKLSERKLPEASQAAEILTLTGRAISETQALVRDDTAEPCVSDARS